MADDLQVLLQGLLVLAVTTIVEEFQDLEGYESLAGALSSKKP